MAGYNQLSASPPFMPTPVDQSTGHLFVAFEVHRR